MTDQRYPIRRRQWSRERRCKWSPRPRRSTLRPALAYWRACLRRAFKVNQERWRPTSAFRSRRSAKRFAVWRWRASIRLEAHRTVVIAPLTGRELDELYVIRIELDSLAAGLAAAKAPRRPAFVTIGEACAAEAGQGAGRPVGAQSRIPPRHLRVLRQRRAHRLSGPVVGPDRPISADPGEGGAYRRTCFPARSHRYCGCGRRCATPIALRV